MAKTAGESDSVESTAAGWLAELRNAVTFYTRIPRAWTGAAEEKKADFGGAARLAPLAGLIVGIAGAAVFLIADALVGLDIAAAVLAVAATIGLTGALHEDGLADFADSLGGDTAAKRLKIMADSTTGAYGATALVLSILVRISLLAAVSAEGGPWAAAFALIATHAVARTAALWVPYALPPARKAGAGAAFGRPDEQMLIQAAIIALIVAFVAGPAGIFGTAFAVILCAAAAFVMALLANRLVGGQTGDVSGATEQVCEIAYLLGLAVFAAW